MAGLMWISTKKVFVFGVCLCASAHAAVIFKGDAAAATNQTFTFAVGPVSFVSEATGGHQLAPRGLILSAITGANERVASNQWALSMYLLGLDQFVPMAPAQVTLNDQVSQANPLNGQKIKFIASSTGNVPRMDDHLFFAVADQEGVAAKTERITAIYNSEIKDATKPTEVSVSQVQSDVPRDSAGTIADYIIGMIYAYPNAPVVLTPVKNSTHFGAPTPTGTSGIAGALYSTQKTDSALTHTLPLISLDPRYTDNVAHAVLFDTSLAALSVSPNEYDDHGILRINAAADMAHIIDDRATPLDLHWDGALSRLYMAVQIEPGAGASTGARAIIVGRFSAGKLYYEKIIPNGAFASARTNLIVGVRSGQLDIYHVRTMHTSTALPYLIIHGGVGAQAPASVYALPLAQTTVDNLYGTIANCTQNPTNSYSDGRFVGRSFTTPATTADTIYGETDPAVLVGGGPLPYTNEVGSIFVAGDSVYMTVSQDYDGQGHAPGIYQSQAIFGSTGKIIGWSAWQRVTGSDDVTYQAAPDQASGAFWWLTGTGRNIMKRSVWSTGAGDDLLGGPKDHSNQGFLSILSTAMPKDKGGVQSLADFTANDSGMGTYAVTLAGGLNTVVVGLTGQQAADGVVHPIFGDFAIDLSTNANGAFPAHTNSTRTFIMSGGALEQLGPINCLNIVTATGDGSYIVAGGTSGIAILCSPAGNGYHGVPSTNFAFKYLGNFGYTRKIWGDGNSLYILTDKALLRAPIDPAAFASGSLVTTELLRAQDNASLSDIVGQDRALVACSTGLLYNAGTTLALATNEAALKWTHFALPESLGQTTSLQLLPRAGASTIGQVFALSAYQGYDLAREYRLLLDQASATPVSFIGDEYLKDTPSYFVSYANFRSYWATNGSIDLTTRPLFVDARNDARPAQLSALPPWLIPGTLGFPARESVSLLPTVTGMSILGNPTRLSSSGASLVAGDYLHVCE